MKAKRLLFVFLFGAALVGAVAFYLHFWLSRPVGNGPAGPSVSKDAFARSWSTNEILLVGLGDSVTAGFGARKGYSYFDRLVVNPPDEFADMQGICLKAVLPNLHYTNLSESGSTSLEHAEKQIPRLPTANSNVIGIVVMTTGGNDLIHNYGRTPPREGAMYGATLAQAQPWIANYEQRLSAMFRAIDERFPGGCAIFVADIYDPSDGVGDPESTWALPAWPDCLKIVAAYNDTLRRVAARHTNVFVVPVHDAFLGHGIHCRQVWRRHFDWRDPHYWYFDNLEDPNDRGYDAIRRLFLVEMSKVLPQMLAKPR